MNPVPLDATFWLKLVTVIGMLLAMLWGSSGVFSRLKERQQGFGTNSLQALAITFFLPILVIVALVVGLEGQALSALLGTVGGYVLSRNKSDE